MPLFIGDYLGDTMHLTPEQHGVYLLLIMACWRRGGLLPADEAQLAGTARVTTRRWRELLPVISRFFLIADDGWRHKRVTEEMESAQRRINRASAGGDGKAAKASGEQAASSDQADDKQVLGACSTDAPLPSPSPSPSRVEDAPPDGAARKPAKGSRLPSDFILPHEWREDARKSREKHRKPPIDLDLEAELFTNHWLAKAGMNGCKLDWRKTWINWALNSRAPAIAPLGNGHPPDPDESFRAMVRVYLDRGTWATSQWGPGIGEPGCKIPPHVLAEFRPQLEQRERPT